MSFTVTRTRYVTLHNPQGIQRVGACNNCGVCCQLYNPDKHKYEYCKHYRHDSQHHCGIYHKRPKMCREWPRGPMDTLNKPECSYRFVDRYGVPVDAYMDKRVRLEVVGKLEGSDYPFKRIL